MDLARQGVCAGNAGGRFIFGAALTKAGLMHYSIVEVVDKQFRDSCLLGRVTRDEDTKCANSS